MGHFESMILCQEREDSIIEYSSHFLKNLRFKFTLGEHWWGIDLCEGPPRVVEATSNVHGCGCFKHSTIN